LDRLLHVVEQATEDVSELNNCHILLDVGLAYFYEDLFKEFTIVVEVKCDIELRLECLPDVVRLRLGHSQSKLLI